MRRSAERTSRSDRRGARGPEIEEVLDTTDHASGSNPYYQPSK